MNPLVTFIIPTFNEEKNIGACISSVLTQRYDKEKIEILVVDGCSSDRTIEIASKYPVKVLINKKRIIPEACNLGVMNATAEILVFMGADSELPQPNWLELMIAPLMVDEKVAGSVPILIPNKKYPPISRFFSLMQADPIIIFAYGSALDVKDGFITEKNYFPMGITVIRKQMSFGVLSFKSSLSRSEDVDLTYQIVKNGYKFAVVKEAGLYHLYVGSYSAFLRKTFNRVKSFVHSSNICDFNYVPNSQTRGKFLFNLLLDASGVGALNRLIKGIHHDKDLAWLCYPFVLISTLFFYTIVFVSSKEGRQVFSIFLGKKS